MILCFELAGFVAAHEMQTVAKGAVPIPLVAYTTEDGGRKMIRLAIEDTAEVLALGREKLDAMPVDAEDMVFLYDARLPTRQGPMVDAVVLELRTGFMPWARASVAVPYSPPSTGQFTIHRPILLEWKDCDDFDKSTALKAFFSGISAHTEGARLWRQSSQRNP